MQPARSVVMIVDDDPAITQTCQEYLVDKGYEVLVARNGRQAFKQLSEHKVDSVLLDILMPEKDGIETLLEMRKYHPGLKIYAMSGGGRVGVEYVLHAAGKLGADAVLKKPFSLDKLIEVLEQGPSRTQ